jgi:hypothetical protein
MTKRRAEVESPEPERPTLQNIGTTALVLEDGRRVEPGQALPADTPEDRIAFWTVIGAIGKVEA